MNKLSKTILWIIAIIIVIALIWLGYQKEDDIVEGEVIKIGATLPISGSLSSMGLNMLAGLEIKAEEINKEGGINGQKIEVIKYDNQGDLKTAISDINSLRNIDDVDFFFTGFGGISSAIAPTIMDDEILFYLSLSDDLAINNKNLFKVYYSSVNEGKIFAEIANNENIKNITLLYPLDSYTQEFVEMFKENYRGDIFEEVFQNSQTDFKTNLLKIKDRKPEVLLILGFPHHLNIIYKQMREINFDILVYNPNGASSYPTVINNPISFEFLNRNQVIATQYFPQELREKNVFFDIVSEVEEKYKVQPEHNFFYAYDSVKIFSDVAKKCKMVNADCIMKNILNMKFDLSIGEDVKFDESGIIQAPTYIYQIKQGKFIPYQSQ